MSLASPEQRSQRPTDIEPPSRIATRQKTFRSLLHHQIRREFQNRSRSCANQRTDPARHPGAQCSSNQVLMLLIVVGALRKTGVAPPAVGRALDEGKRGYWVCPMTPSAAGSTTSNIRSASHASDASVKQTRS